METNVTGTLCDGRVYPKTFLLRQVITLGGRQHQWHGRRLHPVRLLRTGTGHTQKSLGPDSEQDRIFILARTATAMGREGEDRPAGLGEL